MPERAERLDMATSIRRQPGRPKDLAKREAIIQSARLLFGRKTFTAVTMDAVAQDAGVSKMTLYSHFGDKEALFEAVVKSVSASAIEAGAEVKDGTGLDLKDHLIAIGVAFLTPLLDPDIAGLGHVVAAALDKNADLARRFYHAGPVQTRDMLAEVIEAASRRNELLVNDPVQAAEDLTALWRGELANRLIFGMVHSITEQEIRAQIDHGTDIFLRAYGKQPPARIRLRSI